MSYAFVFFVLRKEKQIFLPWALGLGWEEFGREICAWECQTIEGICFLCFMCPSNVEKPCLKFILMQFLVRLFLFSKEENCLVSLVNTEEEKEITHWIFIGVHFPNFLIKNAVKINIIHFSIEYIGKDCECKKIQLENGAYGNVYWSFCCTAD